MLKYRQNITIFLCKNGIIHKGGIFMEKKKDWLGIVFGTIWFLYAAFVLVNYLSGNLNGSFSVPRLLVAIYDIFGVVPGSIIQMVVSAIVVIFSIRGR